MPLCVHWCECYWCVLGHMAGEAQFKGRLNQLVDEFKGTDEFLAIRKRNERARRASAMNE